MVYLVLIFKNWYYLLYTVLFICLYFSVLPFPWRHIRINADVAVIAITKMNLVSIVLQEALLVPVQVVHQVSISTELRHQVQRTYKCVQKSICSLSTEHRFRFPSEWPCAGTCVWLYSTLPCLVQAPSRLTMLRCGPRWLMIFSSDIKAWVSLLRAVAGRHHRAIYTCQSINRACINLEVLDTLTGFSALHLSIFTATLVEDWEFVSP